MLYLRYPYSEDKSLFGLTSHHTKVLNCRPNLFVNIIVFVDDDREHFGDGANMLKLTLLVDKSTTEEFRIFVEIFRFC